MGGLAAGIVIIIINIIAQSLLGDRIKYEMNAWMLGAADKINLSIGAIVVGIVMKLIIGIILVWLYAAIYPRFGSGLRTALYVAASVWILGAIFFSDFPLIGMISVLSYTALEVMQFLSLFVAMFVGAWIYTK